MFALEIEAIWLEHLRASDAISQFFATVSGHFYLLMKTVISQNDSGRSVCHSAIF